MPTPNAIGTQGTSRPGASSASNHCDSRSRSRPVVWRTPSGSDKPAGRRVPPNAGAQALAPPCAAPYGLFPWAKAPCASPTPALQPVLSYRNLRLWQQRKAGMWISYDALRTRGISGFNGGAVGLVRTNENWPPRISKPTHSRAISLLPWRRCPAIQRCD